MLDAKCTKFNIHTGKEEGCQLYTDWSCGGKFGTRGGVGSPCVGSSCKYEHDDLFLLWKELINCTLYGIPYIHYISMFPTTGEKTFD